MGNTKSHEDLLPYAFKCGKEWDGKTNYIGRAWWRGRWIPAKIVPERKMICISYDNVEYHLRRYTNTQILIAENLSWIMYRGNGRQQIPVNSVEVDPTVRPRQRIIHIGRKVVNDTCCPGRIEFKELYVGYGGDELTFYNNYDVLVYGHNSTLQWKSYKCQKY